MFYCLLGEGFWLCRSKQTLYHWPSIDNLAIKRLRGLAFSILHPPMSATSGFDIPHSLPRRPSSFGSRIKFYADTFYCDIKEVLSLFWFPGYNNKAWKKYHPSVSAKWHNLLYRSILPLNVLHLLSNNHCFSLLTPGRFSRTYRSTLRSSVP